uniref:Uncharacterized protein n=1 Tax=Chelonoidis abingdonii TaxID=106734 RepID=A0A8C0HBU5_CHEAB
MVALLLTTALNFFAIWHIIAFDELQTDHKNHIDHYKIWARAVKQAMLVKSAMASLVFKIFCAQEKILECM